MRRQRPMRLHLNKETLRNLSEQEMKEAAGGVTTVCQPTAISLCVCVTDECGTARGCGG
jgi:hypothetical protein